jgi:glycosyltransferase involved in cell wall biosynthesis
VSVLITLYNKGPFVEEAVHSILANSFTDFELLVVDDASTDDGPARVKAITDPRVRLLESAVNTGRAAAANRGYDAARGEYVAVLDADDIAYPERLAKQVAFLDAHPEVGALGSWLQDFGGSDVLITKPAEDRGARAGMLFGMPVMYGAAMLRRNVLEEHGLRCDTHWLHPGMDRLFLLNIGRHAQYANLQEVLTLYRIGEQNMRHGRNAVVDMHHLYRAVFDHFGIPATKEQIVLQTFLNEEVGGAPPNAGQVRRLAVWIKELEAANQRLGVFPSPEFEAQIEKRWKGLFHRIVLHDAWSALYHMWLTNELWGRAGYWGKVTSERWLGRRNR